MRIDEAVKRRDQSFALGAAVIGICANSDHLKSSAVVAFDQLDDMGCNRMVADIRRDIGQPDSVVTVSRGGEW